MKIWKFYLLKYQLSDLKTYCAFKEDDILKLRPAIKSQQIIFENL